jgi:D-sedoheptulose 7-phosphate isomerase
MKPSKEQTMHIIEENLVQARDLLDEFTRNKRNLEAIREAGDIMVSALRSGNKVISCGNGGSMCDAIHFAEELTGRFRGERGPLAAVAVSDPGHMSCTANDYGWEEVFSRYVTGLGRDGDVLLAISTSGDSENVLRAADSARSAGMKVIGLTGRGGGKLAGKCDVEVRAPGSRHADRAQEIHQKVIHCLIDYIERML